MSIEDNVNFVYLESSISKHLLGLIDSTRVITAGKDKKLGLGNPKGQLFKIIEEIIETKKEFEKNNKVLEIEESCDILFAYLAFHHYESFSEDEIRIGMATTLKKFHERGWIDFK